MKYSLRLFAVLLILGLISCVENKPSTPPTKLTLQQGTAAANGFSEDRLTKIDQMIEKNIEENKIPGAVAIIVRNSEVIYHRAFGKADVVNDRSFQVDDIFRIASQSKAITSTAAMMLWEEGKFGLDQPISDFIPEFKDPQIFISVNEGDSSFLSKPAEKQITFRHLLTHTSGIGYGVIDNSDYKKIYAKAGVTDLFTTEAITIEESVKKLATLPLHHEPGTAFVYSEGLDVMGYLIEILSGMPFDQFLKERIFDPMGMNDTGFYQPEANYSRLVPVQYKPDGNWIHYPVTFYDPDYPIKGEKMFFSGGAGLSSTTLDYAKFLQMYLNKGEFNGHRFLSPTTIKTIMGLQPAAKWDNSHYGLAFEVLDASGENVGGQGSEGTFTWGGYFNTNYFADPELNIIGIVMKQTQRTGDPVSGDFKRMVFSAVEK